ncbi:MAG: SUMF1/EgtB/PvdO family nonheme iron enzyme [Henriciella sp.]|nr:SUMF1/EgtB/PvdO family nonheme iron enzyme [Henriciella sp.]
MALSACNQTTTPSPSSSSCGLSIDELGSYVQIHSGTLVKGNNPIYPEERSSERFEVDAFWIQTHEVTNAQFQEFVDATGYVTEAERGIAEGRAGAGSAVFIHPGAANEETVTWTLGETTTWRSQSERLNAPVVHVTKQDAEAYANWAGGRLPNEVEWEYAAQLGLPDPENQMSGAYSEAGPRANTWQGIFPTADTGEDGFRGIADVGCFEADKIGLYDMIGNVWEWTDTPFNAGTHTIKGGSFLCADNFCRRYRPAARQPQETDFSSNHIGFRIARDTPSIGN